MFLGFVHRDVRLTYQGFRVLPIGGVGADPNADVNVQTFVIDNMR